MVIEFAGEVVGQDVANAREAMWARKGAVRREARRNEVVAESLVGCSPVSHLILPAVHLARHTPLVPLYSYVFAICRGGHQEARPVQGTIPGRAAHPALPSVGWVGV